jgi:anti-sigma B factor antagonist
MDLQIALDRNGEACVLTLQGEVDVYTAPAVRTRLLEAVEGGCPVLVVDMAGVDFIDSSGLGVLVSGLKRIRESGGRMTLVTDRESILKIFRITGLDKVFDIVPTLGEAGTGA